MDKKRILVVDGEADSRMFLATFLESNGYHPILAEGGSRALRQTRRTRPDLIILDAMMPREGGCSSIAG